jgi:S-adenosylmethionine synthetase
MPTRFANTLQQTLKQRRRRKVRKILSIDGKTQCGTANKTQKASHIVSVVDNKGFCIGQEIVDEKSNEITAIPDYFTILA